MSAHDEWRAPYADLAAPPAADVLLVTYARAHALTIAAAAAAGDWGAALREHDRALDAAHGEAQWAAEALVELRVPTRAARAPDGAPLTLDNRKMARIIEAIECALAEARAAQRLYGPVAAAGAKARTARAEAAEAEAAEAAGAAS